MAVGRYVIVDEKNNAVGYISWDPETDPDFTMGPDLKLEPWEGGRVNAGAKWDPKKREVVHPNDPTPEEIAADEKAAREKLLAGHTANGGNRVIA